VLAALLGMAKELDTVLKTLEPGLLRASDAVAVLEAASAVETRAAAIKTLVADRAGDASTWATEGYRSPEAWLSQKTGTSYGEAAATLEASGKLADLPAIEAALRTGCLSGPELNQIAGAATPENEARLLDAASRESFDQLRKTVANEKARTRSAEAERARHERIHRQRFHRAWTDGDGAYCYEGRTTAGVGARMDAAIAAEADRVFKAAYAGVREPAGAYRADAVANLLTGGGAEVKTEVVIRVDAGRLAGGEGMCETSTGSVPVEEAIGAILAGAAVKIVVRDGVDITTVTSGGRHITSELKTAVFERDSYACVRPGCGSTKHLEMHHYRLDHAKGGPAAYWNLATVCSHDHDLISHGSHRLEGGPGRWSWIPPP
jgi:hypothetical protein